MAVEPLNATKKTVRSANRLAWSPRLVTR